MAGFGFNLLYAICCLIHTPTTGYGLSLTLLTDEESEAQSTVTAGDCIASIQTQAF